MATNEAKPDWKEVDTDGLNKLAPEYKALVAARKAHQEKKAEFEAGFIAAARLAKKINANETLLFSYNFGKLSVAVVPNEPKKNPKKSVSFF
jgi:hypothetical protein